MTRILACALAGAAVLSALAGCHSGAMRRIMQGKACNKPQMYSTAQSVPPLKAPAGIDPPDTHSALHIPPLDEPAPPPRKLTDPCLDTPPLFAAPRPSTKGVPSIS
ncbi:MAG TPA: hypothetical protein VMD49_05330 [Steroidobacteraceae bacterium]|nr:hypothetical protein [Steroidobacteraceae bacterium]